MSEVWAKLEGHAVNGVFPLLRYLGNSGHSVVFLTECAKLGRSELALKLVPLVPATAQLQLAWWRACADLPHPHLIRIFDADQCQIGDKQFLYLVTDYADQNLAQLLEKRALTEQEAREMLGPLVSALAFLHEKKRVQGRVRPSNVLVVGEQLKFSTDTIRPFSDGGRVSNNTSPYLPPEAAVGLRTGASDIWSLGVTLCEALTQKQPSNLHSGKLTLPAGLPESFRSVVTRCLSRDAHDRPTAKDLQAWVHGVPLAPSKAEVKARAARRRGSVRTSSTGLVIMGVLGALVVFAGGWAAISTSGPSVAAAPDRMIIEDTQVAPSSGLMQTTMNGAPSQSQPSAMSIASGSARVQQPALPEEEPSSAAVSEVIPDVPDRAKKSIRGSVRVSVRLMIDNEGKVFAALVDNPGPSRYFERLAFNAAQQWTFPPANSVDQRLMVVRFEFTSTGTTAQASPVN